MTYVIKTGYPDRRRFVTVEPDAMSVDYTRKLRATGRRIAGLGPIVESVGPDKSTLRVSMGRDTRRADGTRVGALRIDVAARREGILSAIQTIAEDHAAKLAAKDVEIEAALDALHARRREREALVEAAFKAGAGAPWLTLIDEAEGRVTV